MVGGTPTRDRIHLYLCISMTKSDYIEYWMNTAQDSSDTMEYLHNGKRYMEALFFGHLFIEKLCKALWVKNNVINQPPKIHNLVKLLHEANIEVDEEQLVFLDILTQYQLEGRYPDYLRRLYHQTTERKAGEFIDQIKTIAQWLKDQI